MSKLIRRTVGMKKGGAALLAALQIISLILIGFLLPFGSGPHQQSAGVACSAGEGADQAQTETHSAVRQPLTAADKPALRDAAVFATKLYKPLATQVFTLATARAAAAAAAHDAQGPEAPDDQSTMTADLADYSPYSYVYFH